MSRRFAVRAVALAILAGSTISAAPIVRTHVVLVHGMGMNGSSWRSVADLLEARGYRVGIVQQPLTGLAQDVQATRRTIASLKGPVVLVGHSYGGVVITAAGNDQQVKALVYVAAIQPDKGETMGGLNAWMPSAFPKDGSVETPAGFTRATRQAFLEYAAQDLPAEVGERLVSSQRPTSKSVFTARTSDAAWRHKPTFGIVATLDRTVNPDLQRWMYRRSGSTVTELKTGHMAYVAEPLAVVDVIVRAAEAAGPAAGGGTP